MAETERPTGLLLAGGLSRRFGSDKARFRLEGRSMIERVGSVLEAVAEEVLISVRDPSTRFVWPAMPPVRYVVDHYTDAGPLAGLHAGLSKARTPWVVVAPCDMPFLTVEAMQTLLAAASEDVRVVVARSPDGRLHPLCGCYHSTVGALIAAHLEAGERKVRAFLDRIDGVRLVELPAPVLVNVNLPEDITSTK